MIAGGVSGSGHAAFSQPQALWGPDPYSAAASRISWNCAFFKVDISGCMKLISLQAEFSGVVREEHLGVSRGLSSITGVQLTGPAGMFCLGIVFPVRILSLMQVVDPSVVGDPAAPALGSTELIYAMPTDSVSETSDHTSRSAKLPKDTSGGEGVGEGPVEVAFWLLLYGTDNTDARLNMKGLQCSDIDRT